MEKSRKKSPGHIGFDPKPKTARQAIERLVLANRILSNEGIFDYLGHVSVRNPENRDTFFIARAVAPETVTYEDILEADLEGNVLTQTMHKPYSERIIHGAILKARPDVNAVVHAHPIPIVTLSVIDLPFRPLTHMATIFYDGVPVYDGYDFKSPGSTGMLVTTKEEGERVAHLLGKSRGMLMRGHGYNVVGDSIPSMVQAAVILRDNTVIQLAAAQLGQPKYVSYEEAKVRTVAGTDRAWNYYVARAKKMMPDLR